MSTVSLRLLRLRYSVFGKQINKTSSSSNHTVNTTKTSTVNNESPMNEQIACEEDFFGFLSEEDLSYKNERFKFKVNEFARHESVTKIAESDKIIRPTNYGRICIDVENGSASKTLSQSPNNCAPVEISSYPFNETTSYKNITSNQKYDNGEKENIVAFHTDADFQQTNKIKLIAQTKHERISKDSYFDELNCSQDKQDKIDSEHHDISSKHNEVKRKVGSLLEDKNPAVRTSYFEEIYFPNYAEYDGNNAQLPPLKKKPNALGENYIENTYFPQGVNVSNPSAEDFNSESGDNNSFELKSMKDHVHEDTCTFHKSSDLLGKCVNKPFPNNKNISNNMTNGLSKKTLDITKEFKHSGECISFTKNEDSQEHIKVKKGFKTAFEYIQQYRKDKMLKISAYKKNDELPDRTAPAESSTVPSVKPVPLILEFHKQTDHAVLKILKENILYNDHGIVALNKPYGLACQLSSCYHHHIQKYLPLLAKYVNKDLLEPQLHTIHRLDIGTSGVLLLAKNQETAHQLNVLFKERKIQKTYWAITRGIPSPSEGIIDIPIAEGTIEDRVRMMLKPCIEEEMKSFYKKSSMRQHLALTYYQVLNTSGSAALVQLNPKTGVTHQLRVHLGFGLSCPILGDHKYSHLNRMAPQKLPQDMLDRLQVQQAKVRDLPIHLHSCSVVIPELGNGRNIFIQASLPKHFQWALKKLKLTR